MDIINTRTDWAIEKLGKFAIHEKGKKPKNQKDIQDDVYKFAYINIEAFEKGIFKSFTDGEKCNFCSDGDFLMVWDGSRSGLVGKGISGALGSTLVRINFPGIDNDFAYFFLKSKYQQINTRAKGTGTPHVDPGLLWNYDFPIAPLPEQRAIVAKIEELFSSLDSGIAGLKKAQDQLVIYRRAVLSSSFDHLKDYIPLKKCGLWKGGGTPSKRVKEYWENGTVPWVSSRDVKTKDIVDTERHITELAIPNSSTKWIDKEAILFVVRSGILRRIFPIAIAKSNLCVNQDIQTLTLDERFYSEYVYWFLVGKESNIRHTCSKDGTTVESIDSAKLKSYKIPNCSLKEQHQIVQEIESRLSVCDKVEESIVESLEKSKVLRQSTLKKAFEGKLLNDAELAACKSETDYEPASVLLDRIKKEKVTGAKKATVKKKK